MLIKKLEEGTLLVPERIVKEWSVFDIVIEILKWDVEYDRYLQEYEREQKMCINFS